MATKKTVTPKKTKTPIQTDIEVTIDTLKKEGLVENEDFNLHEYSHAYIDIRFITNRDPIEFRPDGSLIERDPYGKEIKSE